MTDEIYILKNDGQLEAMREQKFDLEDVLQQLVADHPELLSGQQIDPDNPRRWILVNREQGIFGHYRLATNPRRWILLGRESGHYICWALIC